MSQPITVSVTMDAASFRRFRWFDLLQHNRIWKRPLVFTAILLVFAGVCLTQLNTRHEAGLLAGVLALVALGLPAVYFWNCAHGIKIFIQKLGLDKAAKPFYRLQLDETGLSIWMAGEPRTKLPPPASATGTTSTWPTGQRMPSTSTSIRRRLTYGTTASTPGGKP